MHVHKSRWNPKKAQLTHRKAREERQTQETNTKQVIAWPTQAPTYVNNDINVNG